MPRPAPSAVLHRIAAAPRRMPTKGRKNAGARGFALLVTIVLVAFLVLILVGLASFTRVETQVASNSQSTAQARQNALMALNLALGQLQRHAGPDQRVTTRADVTIPSAVTVNATTTASAAISAIDTHWRGLRNRQWTGAWLNSNDDPTTYDSNNPVTFNAIPELQAWLVSGNENAPDTVSPDTVITGLSLASTPLDRILDANDRPHRLLVKSTAGVTAASDLDRAVTAPEITISADVAGFTGPQTVGHYAWWIGDEGIKARANLVDAHATAPSGETTAERLAREAARRQSAQRPAIEAIHSNLSPLDPTTHDDTEEEFLQFQATLGRIISPSQLSYLAPSATTFPDELKNRYHDLTVSSRGVLADAKNGGLKGDLSYLFGLPNLTDFRTALRAHYGTNDIAPLDPDPAVATQLANPLLNSVAALRATFPTTAIDGGSYNATRFQTTATWEQLWSFANQGASFNNATPPAATPRVQTATQHGLYPLIIQTKMFYRLRIIGGAPDGDGINRTGTLSIDALPLLVLANPYAVPLAASDYQVRISGSTPQLVFGNIDPAATEPPSPTDDFDTPAYASNAPTYTGNLTYVLRTTGMAAGEAQIFTIDPDPLLNPTIDGDDRIRVTNSNDNKRIYMKNDFDPVPALTFHTDKSIPASLPNPAGAALPPLTNIHAALRLGRTGINTILYQGYTPGDTQGYLKLLQFTSAQVLTADTEFSAGEERIFIVDPMADGIRQGGGVNSIVNQPPTSDHPAAVPGTGSVFFAHQQAPFLQVNYRTTQIMWTGNSSYSHPLEWARRFTKNGSTGSAGTTPNPWFGANLLRPSGGTTTVRWGIANIGKGQNQTVPPDSIGGASASDVGFLNHLYDIPRPDQPLSSLGQLQHFNTTGYHPLTSTPSQVSSINSWQTNYAVSNSYPQPRVPRDRLFHYTNNSSLSLHYHFDGSSLWNDVLWDRFYFSTYPQTGDFDFAGDTLVNARHRPFRDRTAAPWDDESAFRGDGNPATASNARAASQNLLVEGAFNINSTSVEAWKAVFSSLKNVPVGTETTPAAPFTRTFAPVAGSTDAATGTVPESWTGFRDLPAADIQALAEEMVMQVRKRGPFLSLSDFVNRRLIPASSDTFNLGLSGALQAALDTAINQTSRLAPAFNVKSSVTSSNPATAARAVAIAEAGYVLPTALAGFPGYVLQGDVLSTLGSSISARSDTFTIRTYGDAVNPALPTDDPNYITGRAWCEAVVQRLPDYVDATLATATPSPGSDAEKFGRRFQIVSFRWLSPEDI